MKNKTSYLIVVFVTLALAMLGVSLMGAWWFWADTGSVNQRLQHINQDPKAYLAKAQADESFWRSKTQEHKKQDFLKHYFAPWNHDMKSLISSHNVQD